MASSQMITTAIKHRKTYPRFCRDRRGESIMKNYTIAVAGTGYVGLSIATLLSQHHSVHAVDIVPEKV